MSPRLGILFDAVWPLKVAGAANKASERARRLLKSIKDFNYFARVVENCGNCSHVRIKEQLPCQIQGGFLKNGPIESDAAMDCCADLETLPPLHFR